MVCASDLGCDLLDGFWGVISFGCLCKLLCWFGFFSGFGFGFRF